MKKEAKSSTKGWWYARFRIKWPENMEPSWHIDLLMAHKIIAPVLNQQKNNIALWRFHRRAARDQEGHQFSFTFYSSPKTAQQIFNSLKSDTLLKKMKRSGVIVQDIYDNPSRITTPNIADTSDGRWSPPIKKSWPYFIMGVCQMWLTLITEIAEHTSIERKPLSLLKIIDFYQTVNETIKKLWQVEGGHSLLHHLNAIFGYEPVLVHEVHLRSF